MVWWLRWSWLACLCVALGCYKHHRREEASADAGDPDVMLFVDAGDEAGRDAGSDGSIDAGDGSIEAGVDAGDGGWVDSGIDAGCSARVPDDFPTLQDAIDLSPCDPIIVTQDLSVSTVHVHRSVTITTPESETHAIFGDGSGSVFIVPAGVDVTLERLAIARGRAPNGGGIANSGALTLRNITLHDNVAASHDAAMIVGGGGLFHDGPSLRMQGDILFENNRATGMAAYGGAIALMGDTTFDDRLTVRANRVDATYQAIGGGIAIQGAVSVTGGMLWLEDNVASAQDPMTGVFAGNATVMGGGLAIYSGALRATEVVFQGNQASASNGWTTELPMRVLGGAVYCDGLATLDLSNGGATYNTVTAASGAEVEVQARGGFVSGYCNLLLDNMVIEVSTAEATVGRGGVVRALGGALDLQMGSATITRSIFRTNVARVGLGADLSPGSPLFGMGSWANGGAIAATDTRLTVSDSLIAANTVSALGEGGGDEVVVGGGGIALHAEINQNIAGPSVVTIQRTSVVENVAAMFLRGAGEAAGAGLLVHGRSPFPFPIAIESSTIANNRVSASSPDGIARGAAIAIESVSDPPLSLTLHNVTIARNNLDADDAVAAGVFVRASSTPLMVEMTDSILWGNTLRDAMVDDCDDAVLSGAHNIISDTGCFSGSDSTNRSVDPQLQLMTLVSERCQVLPIGTTSPAHNGGSPGMCPAPNGDSALDQCGRVRNGACDIGALEAQP